MPEILECPSCGRKLKVPDKLLGKTVRCSDCAGTFTAEKPNAAPPPPPPPPAREEYDRRDDDYEDDTDDRHSRRGSRRRSRGGYAAHRGGMVMAFGIVSVVCIFVALGAGVVVGPFAGAGSILGLVFGIMAWVMGGKDLKEMNARRMDPEGRGMTQAGWIMGMIGTILHVLGILCGCLLAFGFLAMLGIALQNAPGPGKPGPAPRGPNRFEVPSLPMSFPDRQPMKLRDYLPSRF